MSEKKVRICCQGVGQPYLKVVGQEGKIKLETDKDGHWVLPEQTHDFVKGKNVPGQLGQMLKMAADAEL